MSKRASGHVETQTRRKARVMVDTLVDGMVRLLDGSQAVDSVHRLSVPGHEMLPPGVCITELQLAPCFEPSRNGAAVVEIGAGGGSRTRTQFWLNGILSPARLPVSPLRHSKGKRS